MKKVLITLVSFTLIIAFLLSGCVNPSTPNTSTSSTPSTTAAAIKVTNPITLVLSSHEMPGTIWPKDIFGPYFNEIEKRTGGRVKIEAHWSSELANVMDAYDAAAKGNVDMAQYFPPMVVGRFPMDEILTFSPYNTMCWRPSRVTYELSQMFPEFRAQYKDTKVLWEGATFQPAIATTKKPIRVLEDCKGLQMLSSGKWAGARWEALGMTPVSLPPSDLYSALQKGILDAKSESMWQLEDWKEGEVERYVSRVQNATPILGIVMNLKKFNSMPADIQKILVDLEPWLCDLNDQVQLQVDKDRITAAIQTYHTEFITIPKDELNRWVKVDQPVLDKYVSEMQDLGFPATKIKDEFLKLDSKYSANEYAVK
jgi:TRAP-type C4-dicarboxylate transport system substrate-binding protein